MIDADLVTGTCSALLSKFALVYCKSLFFYLIFIYFFKIFLTLPARSFKMFLPYCRLN